MMSERPRIVCTEQTCADLYEALDDLIARAGCIGVFLEGSACDKAYKALAKARGETNDYQY